MATIKSSFPLRKSQRLKTAIDFDSSNKLLSNTFNCSINSNKDDILKSPTSLNSTNSPEASTPERHFTPKSLTRHSVILPGDISNDLSNKLRATISPTKRKSDDERVLCSGFLSPAKSRTPPAVSPVLSFMLSPTKEKSSDGNDLVSDLKSPIKGRAASINSLSCVKYSPSRILSPTKRKSDNENNPCNGSISPAKARILSDNGMSVSLLNVGPISPLQCHHSPASQTPKSSRRPSKMLSTVPSSTPRRLFGSPSKQDTINEVATPVKDQRDNLNKSCYSPTNLTPYQARFAAKPYQSAKRCLHTAKPDRLIGRDNEFTEIEDFICDKLDNDTSGSLYVSGAPGTGKTVVVNHVISKLQSEYGGLRTAFINCMTLKDSNAVLQQIHEQLTGSSVKGKDSIRALEILFTTCRESILVVLDEIDQLDSKYHHILYRIFEWPALKNSKVILIGIANALDLTDRVLPRLQASQACRPILMNFRPYTSVQITEILKHRLQRDCIVEPSAVNFCARKVSAVAGDVRKALDICRRAVEMAESESRCEVVLKPADCNSPTKQKPSGTLKKVTITHISKVMSDVYGSSVNAANSSENDFPLQQKLAVCTLLVLVKNGKLKEIQLGKLHESYTKVCKHQHIVPVDQSEFSSILTLLDSRGIVMLKKAKDTRLTKVSLKLDEQELEQTLKDKVLMAAILKEGIPK